MYGAKKFRVFNIIEEYSDSKQSPHKISVRLQSNGHIKLYATFVVFR